MREPWSVNALSLELGPDRRSITKWLSRGDVKPAAEGSKGPLYWLRDAVNVLADGGLLGDKERAGRWRHYYQQESAAREFAGRALLALAKRLPDEMPRALREVLADELWAYVEECDAMMRGKRYKRGESPAWSSMSDRALGAALRSLIEEGYVPAGEEEKA